MPYLWIIDCIGICGIFLVPVMLALGVYANCRASRELADYYREKRQELYRLGLDIRKDGDA